MRRGRRKFTNSQEVPDKLVEDWGLLITQYGDISGVSDKPYRVNQNSVSSIVGSISGQDYHEFGVNEMQQSGLFWSRL